MPNMYEIYDAHSIQYDELVLHEDYQQNLKKLLHSLVSWENKVVVEAGIGTGRVTNLYIEKAKQVYGFDRAPHMLTKLKLNLSDNLHKIKLYNADNLYLLEPPEKGDIFIEGWSFGHTVVDNESNYERIVNVLVDEAKRLTKDDGVIIFIETLGSNSEIPKPSKEVLANFYTLLEMKYGFIRHEIRTDYKFATNAEAARITGFFFGKKFGEDVLKSKKTIIPERTGVWVLNKRDL